MFMHTNSKRRVFLKGSMAASAVGVALGAGLLTPQAVRAAWPKNAFEAKQVDAAVNALMGASGTQDSDQIEIKAPDIAENGAVVPVTVTTPLAAESIAIIAEQNPSPLAAAFNMGPGALGDVSTRIKMGKTGDVVAVVKADGKLYANRKGVKVTIGGCGG
jgi:sulfur-oxidizing protein SoxY